MIVVVILASVCVHVVWCRRRRVVVARWLQSRGRPRVIWGWMVEIFPTSGLARIQRPRKNEATTSMMRERHFFSLVPSWCMVL